MRSVLLSLKISVKSNSPEKLSSLSLPFADSSIWLNTASKAYLSSQAILSLTIYNGLGV